MLSTILEILSAALSIWASKEKSKYLDKKIELEKAYYEEINKPDTLRSDAVLDNLEFELRQLSRAVATQIRAENPSN